MQLEIYIHWNSICMKNHRLFPTLHENRVEIVLKFIMKYICFLPSCFWHLELQKPKDKRVHAAHMPRSRHAVQIPLDSTGKDAGWWPRMYCFLKLSWRLRLYHISGFTHGASTQLDPSWSLQVIFQWKMHHHARAILGILANDSHHDIKSFEIFDAMWLVNFQTSQFG